MTWMIVPIACLIVLSGCMYQSDDRSPLPPQITFAADPQENTVTVIATEAGLSWTVIHVIGCTALEGQISAGDQMQCGNDALVQISHRPTQTLLFSTQF